MTQLLNSQTCRTASSQQPDPDGAFRDTSHPRNLAGSETVHLLLQQRPVTRAADPENPGQVDGRQVDSRHRTNFRENLPRRLATENAAMHVECDRVHPGDDHALVSKLFEPLPTFRPGRLA